MPLPQVSLPVTRGLENDTPGGGASGPNLSLGLLMHVTPP